MLIKIINFIKFNIFSFSRYLFGNKEWVWPRYRLPGLRNIATRDNLEQKYFFDNFNLNLSYELLKFTIDIFDRISKEKVFSLIRLGDGEMHFLNNNINGNLIKRHGVENILNDKILKSYQQDALNNDFVLHYKNSKSFKKLTPKNIQLNLLKKNDYDNYVIYQLISNKLLLCILKKYKVGLIGASEKLNLIKELLKYPEYRENLFIDNIFEYIELPQIGAGKNFNNTYDIIKNQFQGNAEIYLVGMGISKLHVLSQFKKEFNKSVIDIGIGLDALAGVVPYSRPYFANWVNYRIKEFDYSTIDVASDPKSQNLKINNNKILDNF